MDNLSEELITQVDEHDNIVGLRPRSDFINEKLIHRSSYLVLFNSKGELLLQKKSQSKQWNPGLYTYAVGGTVADETYEECIKREIKEAFGFVLPFKELFKYKHFDVGDKAFKTVFTAQTDKDDLSINKNYADSYSWVNLTELKKAIIEHPDKYAPPFIAGIKIFIKLARH